MNLTLYVNMSENNKIGKVLNNATVLTGTLRDGTSIIKPILLIQSSNVPNFNYVYIEDFNRFYYIDNIETVRNNLWMISCSIDVLESFKTDILSLYVIIDKQEVRGNSNLYLDDGSFVTLNKTFNTIVNFPSGFNENGEFILITAGG